MKELKELLDSWIESPNIETRNAFFSSLWQSYEFKLHLWAQGFLRKVKSDRENVFTAQDINIDFFERKLIRIKPYTYREKLQRYESFDGWLWKIHKNWCITWVKQAEQTRRTYEIEQSLNISDAKHADENLLHKDLLDAVLIILQDNPLQYRALKLFYLGFSMKEIAEKLNKTIEGVRGLLKRARQKLRCSELLFK